MLRCRGREIHPADAAFIQRLMAVSPCGSGRVPEIASRPPPTSNVRAVFHIRWLDYFASALAGDLDCDMVKALAIDDGHLLPVFNPDGECHLRPAFLFSVRDLRGHPDSITPPPIKVVVGEGFEPSKA